MRKLRSSQRLGIAGTSPAMTGEESFRDISIDIGLSSLGAASFYHFIGERKQRRRHVEAERLGGL